MRDKSKLAVSVTFQVTIAFSPQPSACALNMAHTQEWFVELFYDQIACYVIKVISMLDHCSLEARACAPTTQTCGGGKRDLLFGKEDGALQSRDHAH